MKAKYLLLAVLFLPFLMGCSKQNSDIVPTDGKFKGTFTVTYRNDRKSGETTLVFENGRYSCSGNPDRIPAGGSGTYSIDNGKITFVEESFWTADFDWNLILEGQYDYQFDGKNLIIYADKNDVGRYEYRLVKQ